MKELPLGSASCLPLLEYFFSKGGLIAIECLDWSDEITTKYNWQDNFSISFYSKEYERFVRYEAY